ncbi:MULTISPECIES: oxygenase MpaB family protein [Rhodomicrobium]|uniref:oxygenase MpaB family protein n=1 Tax=Rhodomicrobium TaxID=1068 RepID=UPI001AEC9930|nr:MULTISPECIES: oxygenase MpaB family protein [Rhodomicrobium]
MIGLSLPSPLPLPRALQRRIDAAASVLLQPEGGGAVDFTEPRGEPALCQPDSVSWRVFKNPVALFVGGVAAVILELAEPAVRTGVWEHSSFRKYPVHRLQRTGMAAMMTVYGPRSVTEAMIASVVRRHDKVRGETPAGESYRANDAGLLNWVQATAGYGFAEAYHRYVRPLSPGELDRFYAEGGAAARLYGALGAPASVAERQALFDAMRHRLEPSPIVFEFLDIMRAAPVFPAPLRPMQRMLVRAAVETTPDWVRARLGLTAEYGLRGWQRPLVKWLGGLSDKLMLRDSPAVQSCRRLGLPADYLYRR